MLLAIFWTLVVRSICSVYGGQLSIWLFCEMEAYGKALWLIYYISKFNDSLMWEENPEPFFDPSTHAISSLWPEITGRGIAQWKFQMMLQY